MPIAKSRLVLGVAKGLTAFLNLDAGLTRGQAPSPEQDLWRVQNRLSDRERRLGEKDRRLREQNQRLVRIRKSHSQLKDDNQKLRESNQKLRASLPKPANKKQGAGGEDRERILRMVGGMWEEMGQLQFDFLREQGLKPEHRFLDVGCGILRGGIHFIPYLEPGHYYGIDKNRELLNFGRKEMEKAGLQERKPTLVQIEDFGFERLGQTFDYRPGPVRLHAPASKLHLPLSGERGPRFETRRRVLCNLLREPRRQAAPRLHGAGRRGDLLLRQGPVPLHPGRVRMGVRGGLRSKSST